MRRSFDYLSREEQFTSPGNCRKPLYSPVYGDDGRLILECTGYKDTDLEISSFREQTDIAYIISRINAGDSSVLPDPNALYADVTDLPNTPIGMVNFLDGLRRQFDSLPAETRELFDNSFSRFVAGVPTHAPDVSGSVEDAPVTDSPTIEKPVEVNTKNE